MSNALIRNITPPCNFQLRSLALCSQFVCTAEIIILENLCISISILTTVTRKYGERKTVCRRKMGRDRAEGQKAGHPSPWCTSCFQCPFTPQPTSAYLTLPDFSMLPLSHQSLRPSIFSCIYLCYELNTYYLFPPQNS